MQEASAESRLVACHLDEPASRLEQRARATRQARLESLTRRVLPHPAIPVEIVDGSARVLLGGHAPRVRLVVRDRSAMKRLLIERASMMAFALAYARGVLDIDGDVLDAVRLKDSFRRPTSLGSRIDALVAVLRW
jgi:hypothetical protein